LRRKPSGAPPWIAADTRRAPAPCQRDCAANPNRGARTAPHRHNLARHTPCSSVHAASPGRFRCP